MTAPWYMLIIQGLALFGIVTFMLRMIVGVVNHPCRVCFQTGQQHLHDAG